MHDTTNLPPESPLAVRYHVVHTTTYHYGEPVSMCQNEVHLTPRNTARQRCLEHSLTIRPAAEQLEKQLDYFGNAVHFFTIPEAHSQMLVTAESDVRVSSATYIPPEFTAPWEQARDFARDSPEATALEARQFLFDSPHVIPWPELLEYAAPSFPAGRPWLEAVLDLTARINREFAYDPTATNLSTPLASVLQIKRGVCQDFAHLQIGCLRALGLPARYISGYLLTAPAPGQPRLQGADASHAWLSAFSPELGWIEFDPTNNLVPSLDHVIVGWGRDYSDVCPIKGVFVGNGEHRMDVSVDVQRVP
jgi:transglutaminase-like putative cysteine protease